MNQTAENLRLAEIYLGKQTEEAAERCVLPAGNAAAECQEKEPAGSGKQIRLDLDAFIKEDPYLRGRILHLLVERLAGQRKYITAAHLQSIERLFLS